MKNTLLWDLTSRGSCKTDVSEEHIASIIRVTRIDKLGTFVVTSNVLRLLVTANVVHSSPILVTLMMEFIITSETLVITKVSLLHIPKDGILK
jgi:hypothetical protein